MTGEELIQSIENDNIPPSCIYNVDIDYSQYFSTKYYKNHQYDTFEKNQKLNILFLDIETYANHATSFPRLVKDAATSFPVTAHTIYDLKSNTYRAYFLFLNNKIKNKFPINDVAGLIEYYKSELIKNKYFDETDNIEIYLFDSEIDLLTESWKKIHEIDPACISGWNCLEFDISFMYWRLYKLFEGNCSKVDNVLSKLGVTKIDLLNNNKQAIRIPEYVVTDLMYLYKIRSDGGLNYGKKQESYGLDWISDILLKLKKFDYKSDGMSLDRFYEENPTHYLLYNIVDVILTKKLNAKLRHVEQHNTVRRLMNVGFNYSLRGSTAWFDTFTLKKLKENNQAVRYGLVNETAFNVPDSFVSECLTHVPKSSQGTIWKINDVDFQTTRQIIAHFPGAYVKNPPKRKILTGNEAVIMDLDASLPPNEKIFIKQNDVVNWIDIENYNFTPGDLTLTWDDKNNVYWEEVLGKVKHDWKGNILRLTTETGKMIMVTDNHSMYGIKKNHVTSKPYILDAKELDVGDYVVAIRYNTMVDCAELEKIKKIESEYYEGPVYDISVKNTERFFGGFGIGAHNTALYPSKLIENNIGFDTYHGRIIDPICNNIIKHLDNILGTAAPLHPSLQSSIFDYSKSYVDYKINTQNKTDYQQQIYFTLNYLLYKLKEINIPLKNLFNPSTYQEYLVLKQFLIPALDLTNEINPKSTEYNEFVNDYLINDDISKHNYVYIIENIAKPSINITTYAANDIESYLKENNLIITLVGTLFYKHEIKESLFSEFLKTLASQRSHFKKLRDDFQPGSEEYNFYDSRQSSVKIVMNTTLTPAYFISDNKDKFSLNSVKLLKWTMPSQY